MKLFKSTICLIWLSAIITTQSLAEKRGQSKFSGSETIIEVIQFDSHQQDNHFTVFNVYGSIDVVGYDGDEILIEAINQVSANNQGLVDEGLAEIGLKIENHGQKIYAYLDSPYTYLDLEKDTIWHSDSCWRQDDCSRKQLKPKAYKYHMDIKVKVPKQTNIKVSTINDGDISIRGIHANFLEVNNINGAIDMVDVAGQTQVNAINKDINVAFNKNPEADSQFQSINGDINITFAGSPDAEVVYQTRNGDLYTNFEVSVLGPELIQTSKKKKDGIQYKLGSQNRLLVGNGGPVYRLETLNGDIKIK
jgi:hypothetical protein